jgi:hypothetical protein
VLAFEVMGPLPPCIGGKGPITPSGGEYGTIGSPGVRGRTGGDVIGVSAVACGKIHKDMI